MTRAKRALVTGGHAGLGEAFCRALTAAGYEVTSLDRSAPDSAVPWTPLICDLADRSQRDAAIVNLCAGAPFDLVILNAGVSATGRFEAIPMEAHRRVIAVNLEAPMVLCSALAARGALAKGGNLVFISSLSHWTGYPGAASYAASKDAIAIYARSIRKPFRRALGVTVSCAFPGPMRTAHAERHAPEGAKPGRRMPPEEAARRIIAGMTAGKSVIVPGLRAKLVAAYARLFPQRATRAMRKRIFDRLDGEVW